MYAAEQKKYYFIFKKTFAAEKRKLCGVKKAPGTIWSQIRLLLLLVGVLQHRTDKKHHQTFLVARLLKIYLFRYIQTAAHVSRTK